MLWVGCVVGVAAPVACCMPIHSLVYNGNLSQVPPYHTNNIFLPFSLFYLSLAFPLLRFTPIYQPQCASARPQLHARSARDGTKTDPAGGAAAAAFATVTPRAQQAHVYRCRRGRRGRVERDLGPQDGAGREVF